MSIGSWSRWNIRVLNTLFGRERESGKDTRALFLFLWRRGYRVKAEERLTDDQVPPLSPGEAKLRSLLSIRYSQARMIVDKYPQFRYAEDQQLSSTLTFLVEHVGIPVERVLRHPWVLLSPPDVIQEKVAMVRSILLIDSDHVALPFIGFSRMKLLSISASWRKEAKSEPGLIQGRFSSRLPYLAHHLKTTEAAIADCMERVRSLTTVPFTKIETVLGLLLDYGVHPADIEDDAWVFQHNVTAMQARLEDAVRRGLPEIKPWMLRCQLSKYESYVQRTLKEQKVKPKPENIEGFLKRRLNLSSKSIQSILWKVPSIGECKASRLEMMITFLLSKGFTPEDIAASPRILRQSVATVAQRLAELSEIMEWSNFPDKVHTLSALCRSKTKYAKFLESLQAKTVQAPPVSPE